MTQGSPITTDQLEIFIETLRENGNVSEAARVAKISRRSAYTYRHQNPEFALEWQHALAEAMDDLEAALRSRAIKGTEKTIFYGGKAVGVQKSFSDTLGVYLLKNRSGDEAITSKVSPSTPKAQLRQKLADLISQAEED